VRGAARSTDRVRFVRRFLLALAVGVVLIAAGTFGAWWMEPGVDFDPWRSGAPPTTWATWVRQDELWRTQGLARVIEHRYVPLRDISLDLQLAVLVQEDIDFFGHGPVDLTAVHEAVRQWWRRGGRLRGASTISQQLAKNLFLSTERSWRRKLDEARLAWWLEHELGKKRVFELYLNVVVFGPGVMGAEAAGQRYFRVAASGLGPEQAASLAAALPAPGIDNPSTASERWAMRREVVLKRLPRVGWLRTKLERVNGVGVEPAP
jgi:monofunctional biosynthetic peptidoglycan transglycosylase